MREFDITKRHLRFFLLVQLLLAVVATVVFKILERQTAGLIAGSCFCIASLSMVVTSLRWQRPMTYATFWLSIVYCFGVSLPLLGTRILNWGIPLSDLTILGISGPLFHRAANAVFLGLCSAIAWDLYRLRKKTTLSQ